MSLSLVQYQIKDKDACSDATVLILITPFTEPGGPLKTDKLKTSN